MESNQNIKTFIIEEHHEAFFVWNYAVLNNLLPAKGNNLFRIDEHSDMETPRFNLSIHELNGDLTLLENFTYNELNIGNFILPIIYQELFNKVY